MIKNNSLLKLILVSLLLIFTACVHDDDYKAPDVSNSSYNCSDLTPTFTLAQLKAMYTGTPIQITTDKIIEGYVSSTDESGNIYKTIFIQDSPSNPTHGFTLSVNTTNNYLNYPIGSKIYVKLKGLYLGTYGNVVQVGDIVDGEFNRIPVNKIPSVIIKSCSNPVTLTPKIVTLKQLVSSFNKYIGCLVQVDKAEFSAKHLCTTYATPDTSINKQLHDPTVPLTLTTRIVRNSGFASFAYDLLPTGNGTFIGVLSKFNSTFQFYINRVSDLVMTGPRLDGIVPSCTTTAVDNASIQQIKDLFTGSTSQISQDLYVKATVTANDTSGNHFKYVYVEDETGGIRLRINKTKLFLDDRFRVGNKILISTKNLYLGSVGGELHLGGLFKGAIGNIEEVDIYKNIFRTGENLINIIPTEKTIPTLNPSDVGKWIKIKDLEFIDGDVGRSYAGTITTNRTLQDCNGNKIILRTSNYADFAKKEVDGGKGDVYGILSIFKGTYQIYISDVLGADLDGVRCDGSTPPTTLFSEDFSGSISTKWTTANVLGAQVWTTTTFGNPAPCAIMNGFSGSAKANEDWLISLPINLTGYTNYNLSFDTDVRYNGNAIQVFATNNYTGSPTTTTWSPLGVLLDINSGAFNTWTNSGNVNLNAYAGGKVYIAFKYTSNASTAATWELDNVTIKAQ